MKASVGICAAAWLLAACSGLGSTNAHHYFVLEAAPARAQAQDRRGETLLLAPTLAAPFYDTEEIVYSRVPGERAYYQYSSWTEPPARAIDTLLAARLESAAMFRAVAPASSGFRGTLLLRTRLVEMFHEASSLPGQVQLVLAAELVDPDSRTLVARRTFSATAPARSFDAVGAVRGFDEAVATVIDDVVEWVGAARPQGR